VTSALDVIGDVHGQFDKLVALLAHLGYRDSGGAFRHPDRSVVFVGDLIDRGPKQLATIDLVRRMVDAGSAQCVMGNHELDAIMWASADPRRPGKHLRDRENTGNQQQHEVFLTQVGGDSRLHDETIAWLKTLPMFLDLPGLRIVHACWHQPSIDMLQKVLGDEHRLTNEMVLLGSRWGHPIWHAIGMVCKGPELELPSGLSYLDEGGNARDVIRVKWWEPSALTYREAAVGRPTVVSGIPDAPLPAEWLRQFRGLPQDGEYAPVLFGHYWFTGTPTVISRKFACLDYSVARGGPLVSYRWDGEEELSSEKLAWV
jgi:Calcineurin-like phosphoesterase